MTTEKELKDEIKFLEELIEQYYNKHFSQVVYLIKERLNKLKEKR